MNAVRRNSESVKGEMAASRPEATGHSITVEFFNVVNRRKLGDVSVFLARGR